MARALRDLIDRSKKRSTVDNSVDIVSDKLIPFTYDGNTFFVAIKDDVLIFDADMVQISTVSVDDLAVAESGFFKKVNEVVTANTNQRIVMYINKVKGVEKLTFTSLFDATYIFRKMVRVSGRSSEGIESIVIEKGTEVLRSYTNTKARFMKSIGQEDVSVEKRDERNDDKSELISILSRIEDGMDDVINDNICHEGVQYDEAKIKKSIALLQELQEKYGTPEE